MARPVEVRLTGDSHSAVTAINRTDRELRGLQRTAGRSHGALGRLAGGLAGLGAVSAGFGFLKSAAKAAGDFEQKTNVLVAALGKTGPAAEQAKTDLGNLAKQLGTSTIFSTKEAAEGMIQLAKAGLSMGEIKTGGIQAVLDLAATEGMELGHTADVMAQAMGAFGLSAKQMPSIADALAGAAGASTASVNGLAIALAQVGPGAKTAGLSLNDTVGTLAAFANKGLKGSDAGTSLKTFLTRLVPTTDLARGGFEKLGLEIDAFTNKDGSMKSIAQVAGQLAGAVKGMSESARIEAFQEAFGADAARAAQILGETGEKGLRKYIKATRDKDAAERQAQARTKGYNGAIEQLRGSWDTLKIAVGEKYRGAMTVVANQLSTQVLPAVTKFVEGIDAKKLKENVGKIIPAIVDFAKKIKKAFEGKEIDGEGLKDTARSVGDAFKAMGDIAQRAFSAWEGLSPEAKSNIALILTAGAALGVARRNPVVKIGVDLVAGTVGAIAQTFASSVVRKLIPETVKVAGITPVRVTNFPAGLGKGTTVIADGPDGKPGKGKGVQAGLGIAAVAALVLPMIVDRLPFSPGIKETISGISEAVMAGSSAAWVATALGLSNPIGWVIGITTGVGWLSKRAQDNQTAWAHQDYVNNGVAGEQRRIRTGMYGLDKDVQAAEDNIIEETKGRRAGDEREADRRRGADISEAEKRLYADRSEADRRRNADAHLAAEVGDITADIAAVRAYFGKVERLMAENVSAPTTTAMYAAPSLRRATPQVVNNYSISVSGAGSPSVTAREIDRYIRRAGDRSRVSVTA